MIIISIDYRKAYDSIKRDQIVETLKFFKVDYNLIENIVKIYEEDTTTIQLREGNKTNFNISSGIRQGCTLSATIFKMITFKIMDTIEKRCIGFKLFQMEINSLFLRMTD